MKNYYYFLLAGSILLTAIELYGQKSHRSFRRRNRSSSSYPVYWTNRNNTAEPEISRYRYSSPPPVKEPRKLTVAESVKMDNCRKAILQDNPQLLQKSMGHNFDINLKYANGETLLQYAVRERKKKCLYWLLERKANVNCTDYLGLSPLFLCSRDNDAEFAEILINAGARTYHQDKTSLWNVFHKAAAENMGVDTLSVLVRERSGINAKDRQGRTPLHIAVSRTPHAELQVVEFLLKHGADVNARDNQGRTPLDLTKQKETVACLLRYNGSYGKGERSRKKHNSRVTIRDSDSRFSIKETIIIKR